MQVFVDMDGVLADFDTGYRQLIGPYGGTAADDADWQKVRETPSFYLRLPPLPDLDILWAGLRPYHPIVLTGLPWSIPEALDHKKAWVVKHLGADVPVIGCASRQKYTYGQPGDVLIDDWEKYRHLWVAMGGHWITHTSAPTSLALLNAYMAAVGTTTRRDLSAQP